MLWTIYHSCWPHSYTVTSPYFSKMSLSRYCYKKNTLKKDTPFFLEEFAVGLHNSWPAKLNLAWLTTSCASLIYSKECESPFPCLVPMFLIGWCYGASFSSLIYRIWSWSPNAVKSANSSLLQHQAVKGTRANQAGFFFSSHLAILFSHGFSPRKQWLRFLKENKLWTRCLTLRQQS